MPLVREGEEKKIQIPIIDLLGEKPPQPTRIPNPGNFDNRVGVFCDDLTFNITINKNEKENIEPNWTAQRHWEPVQNKRNLEEPDEPRPKKRKLTEIDKEEMREFITQYMGVLSDVISAHNK